MRKIKIHLVYTGIISLLVIGLSWMTLKPLSNADEDTPKMKLGDPLPANLFVELAKVANPTVVNISTSTRPRVRPGSPQMRDPFFDLFEQFMGPNFQFQPRPVQSLGTGFIIREDGLIVTNTHVIDKADIIKVQLDEKDKELYEAEVVGKDARTDIALIKISTKKKLPYARLGSSKNLEVGEWVAAFGNPYGHGHTITKGIISAIGREIDELNMFPFIQTDASINPGNSGGPLFNSKGLVVGVNTAIDARAQGIGFAIPIDNVKAILPQLEKHGRVKRGFIGVYMEDVDKENVRSLGLADNAGALIIQVVPDSPAEKSGLQAYDLVVQFGDEKVESTRDLANAVARTAIGSKVKVQIIRDGKEKTLTLKVGEPPQDGTEARSDKKSYEGQKAPFDLGFRIHEYSREMAKQMRLPPLKQAKPVVIDVDPGSPASEAGLARGDIILDVNRRPVSSPQDVLKLLKKKAINVLRILKGNQVVLIYLRPE